MPCTPCHKYNDGSLTDAHCHGFLPDFSDNYNVVESTIYFLQCRTPAWDCHCLRISSFPSTSISSEVRHGRDISVPVWIYSSDTTQTPSNSSWAINRHCNVGIEVFEQQRRVGSKAPSCTTPWKTCTLLADETTIDPPLLHTFGNRWHLSEGMKITCSNLASCGFSSKCLSIAWTTSFASSLM